MGKARARVCKCLEREKGRREIAHTAERVAIGQHTFAKVVCLVYLGQPSSSLLQIIVVQSFTHAVWSHEPAWLKFWWLLG